MLELIIGTNLLKIARIASGFRVVNNNHPGVINAAMNALTDQGLITEEGEMHVLQVEGKDLEDRVAQGVILVNEFLKLVGKIDNVSLDFQGCRRESLPPPACWSPTCRPLIYPA